MVRVCKFAVVVRRLRLANPNPQNYVIICSFITNDICFYSHIIACCDTVNNEPGPLCLVCVDISDQCCMSMDDTISQVCMSCCRPTVYCITVNISFWQMLLRCDLDVSIINILKPSSAFRCLTHT